MIDEADPTMITGEELGVVEPIIDVDVGDPAILRTPPKDGGVVAAFKWHQRCRGRNDGI